MTLTSASVPCMGFKGCLLLCNNGSVTCSGDQLERLLRAGLRPESIISSESCPSLKGIRFSGQSSWVKKLLAYLDGKHCPAGGEQFLEWVPVLVKACLLLGMSGKAETILLGAVCRNPAWLASTLPPVLPNFQGQPSVEHAMAGSVLPELRELEWATFAVDHRLPTLLKHCEGLIAQKLVAEAIPFEVLKPRLQGLTDRNPSSTLRILQGIQGVALDEAKEAAREEELKLRRAALFFLSSS